jgi:2-dehydropantoate 2-reductase
MKVCIYGAGAIGGWIGVGWRKRAASGQRGGARRHARGAAARRPALQANGETCSARCPSAQWPAELGVQDLVVIAVKAPALADVAEGHRPAARARHHGAGGHERRALVVLRRLRRRWHRHAAAGGGPRRRHRQGHSGRQIIGCVVHASCSLDAPGFVQAPLRQQADRRRAFGRRHERVQRWRRCSRAPATRWSVARRSRRTPGTSCGAT